MIQPFTKLLRKHRHTTILYKVQLNHTCFAGWW